MTAAAIYVVTMNDDEFPGQPPTVAFADSPYAAADLATILMTEAVYGDRDDYSGGPEAWDEISAELAQHAPDIDKLTNGEDAGFSFRDDNDRLDGLVRVLNEQTVIHQAKEPS